ncbi:type II toxin-antitoxin system VapC family toxin [Chthoniobacter flavus]|uniref:type II toxin-antitoxin system VapC family toxin n=1 Tax=Chthoniobacter flavus TaxID=191863 RepID=UPI0005B2C005|nr:PIN domain-containing protein [Chthoniobacter flavus]
MRVFADAFFYVALINRRDGHHGRVRAWVDAFEGEIVTTQWVLTEVADAFAESHARRGLRKAFDALAEHAATRIIPVSPEDFRRGLELYDARPDKAWSLTDCISFVIMEEEGLTDALTGDRHFEQAGFRALLTDS